MLVTLLAPATSIMLGAAILGERLAARHFLGLALIALGLAFIDGRLPRALLARAPTLTSRSTIAAPPSLRVDTKPLRLPKRAGAR